MRSEVNLAHLVASEGGAGVIGLVPRRGLIRAISSDSGKQFNMTSLAVWCFMVSCLMVSQAIL